jgi:hypothetical protein
MGVIRKAAPFGVVCEITTSRIGFHSNKELPFRGASSSAFRRAAGGELPDDGFPVREDAPRIISRGTSGLAPARAWSHLKLA